MHVCVWTSLLLLDCSTVSTHFDQNYPCQILPSKQTFTLLMALNDKCDSLRYTRHCSKSHATCHLLSAIQILQFRKLGHHWPLPHLKQPRILKTISLVRLCKAEGSLQWSFTSNITLKLSSIFHGALQTSISLYDGTQHTTPTDAFTRHS